MQSSQYIFSVEPAKPGNRARDTILTLLLWGIYIYLWIPLITLAAWMIGFERFYAVMITYGGFEAALNLLDLYSLMITTIVVSILSWSGLNYYRFRSSERRQGATETQLRDLSEFFEIPETEIERARSAKRLWIDLDEQGRIEDISSYGP